MQLLLRQKTWVVILVCSISVFLGIVFVQKSYRVTYHLDEISWFFHTEFFDELFIHRSLDEKVWTSFESFDHPHLSQYIYGAYLSMFEPSYGLKRDELLIKYGRWGFYDLHNADIIPRTEFHHYVTKLRELNVVITIASLLSIYILFHQVSKNILFSLLPVGILVYNLVFVVSMVRVTSDAHYLFFLVCALMSYVQYIHTEKKRYLYGFAILAGLSMSAKLTGLMLIIGFIYYCFFRMFAKKSVNDIKEAGIVIGLFFLVWIAVNPTLYFSPVRNSFIYFTHRGHIMDMHQKKFPEDALMTMPDKIAVSYCTLFAPQCNTTDVGGYTFPNLWINTTLLLAGIVKSFILYSKGDKKKRSTILFLASIFSAISIITIVILPLNWDRYFLPLVVITTFIQSLGCLLLFNWITSRLKKTPVLRNRKKKMVKR